MTETGVAGLAELAEYAEQYQRTVFDEMLRDCDTRRDRLLDADPRTSLKVFFRLYGFNRAGGMQAGYQHRAVSALERMSGGVTTNSRGATVDPDELWNQFVTECERADTEVYETMNPGVVRDTARLANREGNLFRWVGDEVRDRGRLTRPYEELHSITGIGPKITRFFLRDAVWVCDAETDVRRPDRHRLQSMTKWVRQVAESLWPALDGADDAVLANRIVDACEDAGVSAVAFNQGAWYFAREEVDDSENLDARVRGLCGGSRA